MYLTCGTRPDIAFAVGQLSKYNTNPRKGYLQIAKRVVRYLKGIIDLDLIFGQEIANRFPKKLPPHGLVSYANSNFARDPED